MSGKRSWDIAPARSAGKASPAPAKRAPDVVLVGRVAPRGSETLRKRRRRSRLRTALIFLAFVLAVAAGADGRILANSDGKIVAVHVAAGQKVEKGTTLVVLEAMKMEFQLTTPVAGTVETVSVKAGDQVKGTHSG